MIAGNDRSRLGPESGGAGGVFGAFRRRHEKLIRGDHELRSNARSHRLGRLLEEMGAARDFALQRRRRTERFDRLPAFGRRNDRRISLRDAIAELDMEIAGAPQRAFMLVSSAFTASAARARTGDASAAGSGDRDVERAGQRVPSAASQVAGTPRRR